MSLFKSFLCIVCGVLVLGQFAFAQGRGKGENEFIKVSTSYMGEYTPKERATDTKFSVDHKSSEINGLEIKDVGVVNDPKGAVAGVKGATTGTFTISNPLRSDFECALTWKLSYTGSRSTLTQPSVVERVEVVSGETVNIEKSFPFMYEMEPWSMNYSKNPFVAPIDFDNNDASINRMSLRSLLVSVSCQAL